MEAHLDIDYDRAAIINDKGGGFNMEVLQSVTEEDGCRSFPFKTFARS